MLPILPPETRRSVALPIDVAAALLCPFDSNAPSSRLGAFGHFAAALLFAAIGFFGATQAFPVFFHATQSRHWPTSPGVVTSSHLVQTKGRSAQHPCEVLALTYTFERDGQRFEGSRLRFGVESGPAARQGAREAALRYPAGRRAQVRFNPADPSDCALETTVAGATWTFALVATVGLTLAGLWLMEGLHISRRRHPQSA
ncbi:MAG: DUF3592 domain-containing protein [Planctomycetota bacterium]